MTVARRVAPNYTTQLGATYKGNIDAALAVDARIAGPFAPHQAYSSSPNPDRAIELDAGAIFNGSTLLEVAAQTVTGFTTPSAGQHRIDRVVVDATTGVASRVAGTAATGSPTASPPAIPAGKIPICSVLMTDSDTIVSNSMITDERVAIVDFLPKTGGTMTGDVTMSGASIIETEGAAVASASSCNIWATDGNTVHITGTTTINDFAAAPQAGAWMKVIFDDALTLTQSANLNLNGNGSDITIASGDIAYVYADTTTQMDVVVFPKNGLPINFVASTAWTPADGSGAGLSITVTRARYSRQGPLVHVQADITYPATANGATALISGFPVASETGNAQGGVAFYCSKDVNNPVCLLLSSTSASVYAGPTQLTNAQLTSGIIRFCFSYLA